MDLVKSTEVNRTATKPNAIVTNRTTTHRCVWNRKKSAVGNSGSPTNQKENLQPTTVTNQQKKAKAAEPKANASRLERKSKNTGGPVLSNKTDCAQEFTRRRRAKANQTAESTAKNDFAGKSEKTDRRHEWWQNNKDRVTNQAPNVGSVVNKSNAQKLSQRKEEPGKIFVTAEVPAASKKSNTSTTRTGKNVRIKVFERSNSDSQHMKQGDSTAKEAGSKEVKEQTSRQKTVNKTKTNVKQGRELSIKSDGLDIQIEMVKPPVVRKSNKDKQEQGQSKVKEGSRHAKKSDNLRSDEVGPNAAKRKFFNVQRLLQKIGHWSFDFELPTICEPPNAIGDNLNGTTTEIVSNKISDKYCRYISIIYLLFIVWF